MRVQWTPAILDSQFCLLRSHVTHFVANQMSQSSGRANQSWVLSLGKSNVTKFFWFLFSEAKGEKVDALFRILRAQTKNNCCSCKCLKMALLNECVFTTGLVDSAIVGSILKTFNFCAEAEGLPKLTNVRACFVFFFFKCIIFQFYLRLSFIQNSFVLSLITPLHNSWIIPTLTPVYSDVSNCTLQVVNDWLHARRWRGTAHLFQWKPKGSQQRNEEIIMISRTRNLKLWSFKKWRTWKYFKWITRHLLSGIWRIMQIWGNVTHLGHNSLFHRNNSWSIIVKYYFFYFVVPSSHHQEVDFPPPNNFQIIDTI